MTQLHQTHLRVVSVRWATIPIGEGFSRMPPVLQIDNLSDLSQLRIVNLAQSFGRMVIPYTMNLAEARTGGLVVRRPLLRFRVVRVDAGQFDYFWDILDWPAPEIYVWQATDDRVYYARDAGGITVPLTSRGLNDIDLALRISYRLTDGNAGTYTIHIDDIVAIPIAG